MKKWILSTVSILLTLVLLTACAGTPATPTTTDVTVTDASVAESVPATTSTVESVVSSATAQSNSTNTGSFTGTTSVSGSNPNPDNFGYNTNLDIEDNVFMDALIYTGYNMEKHRADGRMWIYILSKEKRGMGYLSGIGFGGGSSGLETTADGKPDIAAFKRGGLVCASFATYVYFNYLPNVAGIDTSMLTKPDRTYNAHSFYTAVQDWERKGYTYTIGFTASRDGNNYIQFKPEKEIPIGSILVFEDDRKHDGRGSHITIYAGYKNGHHWVYQVGTSNGPEMSAVDRMLYGPDPMWPLKVYAAPTCLYANQKEVSATDR